jgi:type I restriction enzyme S subunit
MTRGLPKVGDIVMTTEAPLGEVGQILKLPVALAQRIVTLRGKSGVLHNDYLLYALQSEPVQAQLRGRASGTTVVGIKQSELRKVKLSLPCFDAQIEVAGVLRSLDNRIDLLRQTNATLESIAQALFKSWFIDFDPVRAKAGDREPEGMDAATAALFPLEFEGSELGPVPKGWTVQPIGDLVEAVGGSTPDTKNETLWEPAVHHWTSPKDLSGATAPVLLDTERKVSEAGLARISSGLLPVGTLLMSSRAPIGYLSLSQIPVAINQGYIAMPPGGRLPPAYTYFWCQLNMDAIKGRANGSTFMEISKKAFRPIPAVLPSPEVVNRFNDFATAVFSRVTSNEKQARALAELRDTLLPRLISGKLQLQDVRIQREEALA